MPARQRGWVRKRKGGWQACWREGGKIRTKSGFLSKTLAEDYLDDHLENGTPRRGRDTTFRDHVERYLRIHAATVEPATIQSLRDRLGAGGRARPRPRPYRTAIEVFGELTLAELELMSVEIAEWQTTLPPRFRHAIVLALRQVLNAALRWKLIRENPAKEAGPNPRPPRVEIPVFASLADVDAVDVELGDRFGGVAVFGVETGLRPEEWIALERRDLDRQAQVVRVRRVCVDGRVREYGKTSRFRRDVPLTARAVGALDARPPRIDTQLLFPAARGGLIDLDNFRRREWHPAMEAAGLALCTCGRKSGDHDESNRAAGCPEFRRSKASPAPYSMRHTYASFALDAGVSIFELARYMGTSVKVIDETYGHLVRTSHDRVRQALEERAAREAAGLVAES